MIVVTVIYPVSEGSTFDADYYRDRHLPLVASRWGTFGLGAGTFLLGAGAPGGGPASYHMVALLPFPSKAAFLQAAEAHGKEIMGDIKHFTSVRPQVQFNETLG